MVEHIRRMLWNDGYRRIQVANECLNVYAKVVDGFCYFVDVVDYTNPNACSVSTSMLEELNNRLKEIYSQKGFRGAEILTIIVTYSEILAAQLAGSRLMYWVMDSYNEEFIIPAGQPAEFDNAGMLMKRVLDERAGAPVCREDFGFRINNKRPAFKLFSINNLIILINVLVFVVLESMGSTEDTMFMLMHGAFYWPAVYEHGEIYRFFTSMFIHFGFSHLFCNMLVLFFLGDNLERALGKLKYIAVYIICGVGASIVSCIFYLHTGTDVISGGASGAIFGVVGALIYIVTLNHGRLEDLDSYRLIIFAVFSLYSGITGTGVDNAAHVGGFVIGLLAGRLLYKKGGNTNEC